MSADIVQLGELISQSIATIVKTCEDNNLAIPSLTDLSAPTTDPLTQFPAATNAVNIITAAAVQLLATVSPRQTSLMALANAHFRSAALRVAMQCHITEILRDAGPQGLHINDLAARANVDPVKLGRLLRLLTLFHVYQEVTPDVYANTRLSQHIDSGKPVEVLQTDRLQKHRDTPGHVAILEIRLEDGAKASSVFLEHMQDKKSAFSFDPTLAPFPRSLGQEKTLWEIYKTPEYAYHFTRLNVAMFSLSKLSFLQPLFSVLDWSSLPKGTLVVDVGGGLGSISLALARKHTQLNFVVQDDAAVVADGRKLWAKELPEALENDRVQFQPHDFFQPQPVKNADVFILKHILHDWADTYSVKILKQLREAARPETKLVIGDLIILPSCHDPNADGDDAIPGAAIKEAPAPLLPNFGAANESPFSLDLNMFGLLNAQERTLDHIKRLLKEGGWRIINISRQPPPSVLWEALVAVPIDN